MSRGVVSVNVQLNKRELGQATKQHELRMKTPAARLNVESNLELAG
jgi:hypothetical protein